MPAAQQLDLSIVIVNYRTPALVIDCLETLLSELRALGAKVVVVDNNSGDDSLAIIRNWLTTHDPHNRVLLVQSETNSGFAGGNNIGIRTLGARFYLLLNSDTRARPGAIRILLETAGKFPGAGLISPRLEWPDGRGQESCFRLPTPYSELMASAQTALIDRFFKNYIVPMPVQDQMVRPQWTSFACVLIRNEVFHQIGLLDEGYFMYFEDAQFCQRAGKAGWGILHNPEARVVHLRGGSSPVKESIRQKKRLPKYFHESRTRFFYQVYGWLGLIAANVMWWLGRLISKARQVMGRPDKAAIERQWLDIWTNWLRPLRPYTPPRP
jgi:N-acetylglucosaminyl-diphospho-decaprenol L-rhamnosyltransferase